MKLDAGIRLAWNPSKSETLKASRGVGFEDVLLAVQEGRLLRVVDHHNQARYPNQYMLIVWINEYAYEVPFVVDGQTWFLKTLYPSRKWVKFLTGSKD